MQVFYGITGCSRAQGLAGGRLRCLAHAAWVMTGRRVKTAEREAGPGAA